MRLHREEAAVRARISVPPKPRPALRCRSSPSRRPESAERAGLTWGHAEWQAGNATRRGLGTRARIKVGN